MQLYIKVHFHLLHLIRNLEWKQVTGMPKIPPWRQILKPILSWFRGQYFPQHIKLIFQRSHPMNTNDYKNTYPETFQRGKHAIIQQLFWIMFRVLLRRQRAHFREQMLWFIHPACWRLQRANPHLWFKFIAGESINPYCFLLISCHIYFSLYLPPSGHACLLCMFPDCLIIF